MVQWLKAFATKLVYRVSSRTVTERYWADLKVTAVRLPLPGIKGLLHHAQCIQILSLV